MQILEHFASMTTTEIFIQVGAILAAGMSIYVFIKRVWPKLKLGWSRIQWVMTDQHDHTVIMEKLDILTSKLSPNGGSAIPDQLRRIEHAVMFQNARTQASLHMNPAPIFETDENGGVTFVNTSYKKMFGIDSREAMGRGFINIIAEDARDEVTTKWFRAVKDKRTFDESCTLIDHDGKRINTHVIAYVIRGEQNNDVLGHHGEVTILDENE
jgi:PAS domain S-box-containing protein